MFSSSMSLMEELCLPRSEASLCRMGTEICDAKSFSLCCLICKFTSEGIWMWASLLFWRVSFTFCRKLKWNLFPMTGRLMEVLETVLLRLFGVRMAVNLSSGSLSKLILLHPF